MTSPTISPRCSSTWEKAAATRRQKRTANPKTIFLAATTSDLEPQRDQLRRELIELGHTVVPKQPLPLVASELVAVVQGCLEQADIAIHFVGEHFGLVPEATDLSMVALQNQVAARHCDNSSLKRLIWIPKGLQPRDERQTSFIRQLESDPRTVTGAELIADTLENLKVLLRTRWEREQAERDKPPQRPATGGAPRVYLICDQQDEAALEPLEDFFYAQGIEVSLPGFEAEESEVQQIHIQNLRDCDAALIYYGAAGMHWVDFKIRDLQKAAGYRDSRPIPVSAVYVAPPFNHRKERFKSVSTEVIRQAERLVRPGIADGLRRGHPAGEGGRPMKTVDTQLPNPFPGLRPFRSDEHHLFFGREEQTAALLQLLRTNRFLAVVGTSGSGKSSLVRAGMIAELHGGTMTQAGSTWEVMILRPGGSPIENLARAFVEADLYDRRRSQHPAAIAGHAQPQPLRPGRSDETVRAVRTGHQPAGRGRSVRGVVPLSAAGR